MAGVRRTRGGKWWDVMWGLEEALTSIELDVTPAGLHRALVALIGAGLNELPLPCHGQTLARWQTLAAVAESDLALVKLVEGHTDALAIMAELGSPELAQPGSTWGTWAAEPPDAQVLAVPGADGQLSLSGRKAWCSGSTVLSHGLLTCRGPQGEHWLAALDLGSPGVLIEPGGWQAVGMAATQSVSISFADAPATLVGGDGDYLRRIGFWAGGGGIAACWWGGARGVADALHTRVRDRHAAAHLGAVETALASCAALLRESAALFDTAPSSAVIERVARTVRAAAEATVTEVLERVGRATGAGPLCLDGAHAHRVADLTVFVRQSHAERDLAGLGDRVAAERLVSL